MPDEPTPYSRATAEDMPAFVEVMGRLSKVGIGNQSDLARKLGVSPAGVSDAKKRGPFPLAWALMLARVLDVSLDYILGLSAGFGDRRPPEQTALLHPDESAVGPERLRHLRVDPATGSSQPPTGPVTIDGFVMVPKHAARLSGGPGSWDLGEEVIGFYAFREEWLRSKGSPGNMALMDVFGHSMEPDLRDGDTVLIDRGQQEVEAGRIYAVGIEDTAVVKWVEKRPGALLLRSSNPDHLPIEVDMRGDLADTVRIIGRIIWWCREAR